MAAKVAVIVAICISVALTIIAALALVVWNDSDNVVMRAALRPDWTNAQRALIYGLTAAALIAALGKAIAYARHEWTMRKMVYAREGMLPAVATAGALDAGHITPAAQFGSSVTHGTVDRLGNWAKEGIKPPELALPEPAISVELLPADVTRPDYAHRNIISVVGQQGSGKSTLLYYIMRQWTNAEYIIMSTLPINWFPDTAITTPDDMYDALEKIELEHQRRQQLAVRAGVHDWHTWDDRPSEIVVVVDELENGFDRMRAEDRQRATRFSTRFRTLIKETRNSGFAWILATQTADGKIVDGAFISGTGTLLLMRMMPATAARFYQYDSEMVKKVLPNLPPGRAYAFGRDAYVQFPMAQQPRVRLSSIVTPTLQLAADAGVDGFSALDVSDAIARLDDDPTTQPVQEAVYRTDAPPNGGFEAPRSGIPVLVPQDVPPSTEHDKLTVWRTWKRMDGSLSATVAELYKKSDGVTGQKGGAKFYWVRSAVEEMEARRGRRLQEEQ